MKTAPNLAGSDTGEISEHTLMVEPAKTAFRSSQRAARECEVGAGATHKVGVRHR
jgi:hypothetical protein